MDNTTYNELIIKAFNDSDLGKHIDENKANTLHLFSNILVETNKSFNLTSITDEKDIILKHFIDSASIIPHIPPNASFIDIGCGAGFPSLPIAILRDDITVTSIDSTSKKINFINSVANELSLKNISAISSRAEDFAKKHREEFDVSTSRAVAKLNILDELCLPLTKIGGKFIAMKSSRGSEEYEEAEKGIAKLGGKLSEHISLSFNLFDSSIERELFIISKASKTPIEYPRNYSQISKKPL